MNVQTERIYSNLGKKDLHLEYPDVAYEFKEVKIKGKTKLYIGLNRKKHVI